MLDGAIRTVAIVACLIVGIAFLLFAVDELRGASHTQVVAVEDPGGTPTVVRRDTRSGVRRAIDDASDTLVKPFRDSIHSSSQWVEHGVPAMLGLLVYGFGLGYLARYVRARA